MTSEVRGTRVAYLGSVVGGAAQRLAELRAQEPPRPVLSPAQHGDGEMKAVLWSVVVESDVGEVLVGERVWEIGESPDLAGYRVKRFAMPGGRLTQRLRSRRVVSSSRQHELHDVVV